jgi:hypothetical protein
MSGMISGSDCTIQAGQTMCTSKIEWSTTGAPEACVFANGVLFACQGEKSSKLAPWITEGGVLFELKASNQINAPTLASKKVFAISPYQLSGSNCFLMNKPTCSSLISWNAPGFSEACVFANGVLFACQGEQSSKLAPWITMNGVTFELRINRSPSSTLLKKIVVIGM